MPLPLKIVLILREIALFYTNFTYKFSSLWSKVEGHLLYQFIPTSPGSTAGGSARGGGKKTFWGLRDRPWRKESL